MKIVIDNDGNEVAVERVKFSCSSRDMHGYLLTSQKFGWTRVGSVRGDKFYGRAGETRLPFIKYPTFKDIERSIKGISINSL
jgi:hypothetical protein